MNLISKVLLTLMLSLPFVGCSVQPDDASVSYSKPGDSGAISMAATMAPRVDNKNFGVNLAGAEWGAPPSNSDIDYYAGKGIKFFRLPISWERIQPALNGNLDATELNKIKSIINYANTKNMLVLIDLHNYCRRQINGVQYIIGSPQVSVANIKDTWSRLANEFKGFSNIWGYGLMNEPHDMGSVSWFTIAQELIYSIRAIDTVTPIVVGGDVWSGATEWPKNSDNLKNLVDPSGKLIYEAHCYWDIDGSSGSYSRSDALKTNPNRGIERVAPFVKWLADNGKQGFVGEYGIPNNDPAWNLILDNYLKYLSDNGVNGTYWAGGSFNADYDIGLTPKNGVDKSQIATIQKYLTTTGGPSGYTFCANENQSYTFSQTVDVVYGANGKYNYTNGVVGTITFNNATFGDPVVGVPKKGYYKIRTAGAGAFVTMRKSNALTFGIDGNNGGANGQLVYLWAYDANNINQQWDQIDRGGGFYSYQKRGTSYCLDGGNGGANGQAVYLWTRDDANQNQHWKKVDLGGGYFRLEKRNASGFSIDGGNGGANGQLLKLWASDNNNQNQRWLMQ